MRETRLRALADGLKGLRLKTQYPVDWSNFSGNVHSVGALVVYADREEDVETILEEVYGVNHPEGVLERGPGGAVVMPVPPTENNALVLRAVAGSFYQPSCWSSCLPIFGGSAQKTQYDASYSFTEGGKADVLLCFTENYRNAFKGSPLEAAPGNSVDRLATIPAGMQVGEAGDWLWKQGYSLPRTSVIRYVSVVGLAANSGLGTGREDQVISAYIEAITVCFMNASGEAETREYKRGDPYFSTLSLAHFGLFGVVTKIKLRVLPRHLIQEEQKAFRTVADLTDPTQFDLAQTLRDSEACFVSGFPVPNIPRGIFSGGSVIRQWEVISWKKLPFTPEGNYRKKPEEETKAALNLEETFVRAVDDVFMKLATQDPEGWGVVLSMLAAAYKIELGSGSSLGEERLMTRYQSAFPRKLEDFCILFPVPIGREQLAVDALRRWGERLLKLDFPITYQVYLRFLKGQNGNSLACTDFDLPKGVDGVSQEYHVCSLEMLTYPGAPQAPEAKAALVEIVRALNGDPLGNPYPYHIHPGKEWPENESFMTRFKSTQVTAFFEALCQHYEIEGMGFSPREILLRLKEQQSFISDYFVEKFTAKAFSAADDECIGPCRIAEVVPLPLPEAGPIEPARRGSVDPEKAAQTMQSLIRSLAPPATQTCLLRKLNETLQREAPEIGARPALPVV